MCAHGMCGFDTSLTWQALMSRPLLLVSRFTFEEFELCLIDLLIACEDQLLKFQRRLRHPDFGGTAALGSCFALSVGAGPLLCAPPLLAIQQHGQIHGPYKSGGTHSEKCSRLKRLNRIIFFYINDFI